METDLQLLHRYVASRDADAFAGVVRRHSGMVYGTCLRVTGNAHSAEDAAQECFLQLARHAGIVRDSVAGWLHRKAVSRAMMTLRSEARRKRREEGAARMNGAAKSHVEPAWSEIAPHVDEALANLSSDLREPLIRHFLENKTQTEIAQELHVDQSTISRRLDRGIDLPVSYTHLRAHET